MADEAASPARRRAIALGALWAVVSGAVLLGSGCYGHNCDVEIGTYGREAGQGHMLDVDTWESGPIEGPWLWFPRQRIWIVQIAGLGNRQPEIIIPYVSAQADPLHEGGNFTIGSGNIAQISNVTNGSVTIQNGTCADYYLHLVVSAAPLPSPVEQDASAPDAAAALGDAGADAADAGDAEAGP